MAAFAQTWRSEDLALRRSGAPKIWRSEDLAAEVIPNCRTWGRLARSAPHSDRITAPARAGMHFAAAERHRAGDRGFP